MDLRPSRRFLVVLAAAAGVGLAACAIPPTLPSNPPPFQTSRHTPSPTPEDASVPALAAWASAGGIVPVGVDPVTDRGPGPHLHLGLSLMPAGSLRLSLGVYTAAGFFPPLLDLGLSAWTRPLGGTGVRLGALLGLSGSVYGWLDEPWRRTHACWTAYGGLLIQGGEGTARPFTALRFAYADSADARYSPTWWILSNTGLRVALAPLVDLSFEFGVAYAAWNILGMQEEVWINGSVSVETRF